MEEFKINRSIVKRIDEVIELNDISNGKHWVIRFKNKYYGLSVIQESSKYCNDFEVALICWYKVKNEFKYHTCRDRKMFKDRCWKHDLTMNEVNKILEYISKKRKVMETLEPAFA